MKKISLLRRIVSLLIVMSLLFSMMLLVSCQWIEKFRKENEEDPDGGYVNERAAVGRADFIERIGGVSDTYRGTASEKTYDTSKVAAIAFVNEEVLGNKAADFINVNSMGMLSQDQLNSLNFPADVKEGMLGVERFEITYSTTSKESDDDENTMIIVYVIKYDNGWKYFSPAPAAGNPITKSYYDSVFNEEKYKNCTFETELKITLDIKATEDTETHDMYMEVTAKQFSKYQEGRLYVELHTSAVATVDGETETEEDDTYIFIEDRGTYIACYVKKFKTAEWTPTSINNLGFTIEELAPFYEEKGDFTYFTKTGFGFAIEAENAKQYFNKAMKEAANMLPDMFNEDDMLDMYAEYYVSEGVLSGMRLDANVELNFTEGNIVAEALETVSGYTIVTDIGTTVVESPTFD